jgi:hypothetical protein
LYGISHVLLYGSAVCEVISNERDEEGIPLLVVIGSVFTYATTVCLIPVADHGALAISDSDAWFTDRFLILAQPYLIALSTEAGALVV